MPPAIPLTEGSLGSQVFSGGPYPVLVVDKATLRIAEANAAALAQYGYGREQLIGRPLVQIWPRAEEVLAQHLPAGPALRTWRHRRGDGAAFDAAVAVQPLMLDERPALALHVCDVTERALSVALLEDQGRVLEMVASGRPLEEVLAELVRAIERQAPGLLGSILLADDEGVTLRCGAAPSLPASYRKAIAAVPVGPQAGSCGAAAYFSRPIYVFDIAADPRWRDYREAALRAGLRACWSTPILSSERRLLGTFAMYYREARKPGERDLRLVSAATGLAAVAIERDIADRRLKDSESRLRAVMDNVPAVVYVKDLDGRYTLVNRHFERVSGTPAAAALGRTDAEILPREVAEAFVANDRRMLEARAPLEFEEVLSGSGGERVYLSVKLPLLRADRTPYAICGISSDITQLKRKERELERSHEQLRALTARVERVREDERTLISREIHDELGQALTALRMDLTLLIRGLRSGAEQVDRPGLAAQLDSVHEQVKGALASVRRIATELRPDLLDSLGLAAALEWHAKEFTRRTGIPCSVTLAASSIPPERERDTALFRICQEALTNVARHAGARTVRIELREEKQAIELSVADDGRGIAPAVEQEPGPSLGLLGMRERAAALGGELRITGAPGSGTTVVVRLPAGTRP